MYTDILIPTDGSDTANQAATHGLSLAKQYEATVHALFVVNTDVILLKLDEGHDEATLQTALRNRGERVTDLIAERARDEGVSVTTAVREGRPADEIRHYAEENGIDLLTMGTHGRSRIDRFLIGSVTRDVFRTVSTPTLTTRRTGAESIQETQYCNILIPTDGSNAARRAASHGIDIAARYGATVHGLYVANQRIGRSGALLDALRQEGERVTQEIIVAAAREGVAADTDIVEGIPYRAIIEYVDTHSIDLIVLRKSGKTGLDRLVLGRVTERVLRTVPVPTLVV